MPFPSRAGRIASDYPVAVLGVLLGISEAGYIAMVRLNAVNGLRPVVTFLSLMAALFGCYAGAIWLVGRIPHRRNAGVLVLIAAGAMAFRLTLLGAGLPHGPIENGSVAAIQADLSGKTVAYERFLIFRMLAAPFASSPDGAARILSLLAVAGVVAWTAWRDGGKIEKFAGIAVAVLGFSILFSPVVMPWYIAGVLPLAAISDDRLWVWYSALVLFAFVVMIDGVERHWALAVEYGIFLAPLVRAHLRQRQIDQLGGKTE